MHGLPAGSGSLRQHTSHSSPSDVCSAPGTPSDPLCLADYQPRPTSGKSSGDMI